MLAAAQVQLASSTKSLVFMNIFKCNDPVSLDSVCRPRDWASLPFCYQHMRAVISCYAMFSSFHCMVACSVAGAPELHKPLPLGRVAPSCIPGQPQSTKEPYSGLSATIYTSTSSSRNVGTCWQSRCAAAAAADAAAVADATAAAAADASACKADGTASTATARPATTVAAAVAVSAAKPGKCCCSSSSKP